MIGSLHNDTSSFSAVCTYNAIPRLVVRVYECWAVTPPAAVNVMDVILRMKEP